MPPFPHLASSSGIAAGNALLALAGPVGWGIAGATLLTSIVLFKKNKRRIFEDKQKNLIALKENTERVKEMGATVNALLENTSDLRDKTAVSIRFPVTTTTMSKDYLPCPKKRRRAYRRRLILYRFVTGKEYRNSSVITIYASTILNHHSFLIEMSKSEDTHKPLRIKGAESKRQIKG